MTDQERPKIDAVDAHAYAMFAAGWQAALRYAEESQELGVDLADLDTITPPSARSFYEAVPSPAARECGLRHVVGVFAHETQALQARVRALLHEADLIAEQGLGLRRLMEQREEMIRAGRADVSSTSPTLPSVLAFAYMMEKKLEANRHKGGREGWRKESPAWLLDRLKEEVAELEERLAWRPCGCRTVGECTHPSPRHEAWEEAADVANFAMMIADVTGGITT